MELEQLNGLVMLDGVKVPYDWNLDDESDHQMLVKGRIPYSIMFSLERLHLPWLAVSDPLVKVLIVSMVHKLPPRIIRVLAL